MYDLKTIKKALKLLKQYDYKFIKVSRMIVNTKIRVTKKADISFTNYGEMHIS